MPPEDPGAPTGFVIRKPEDNPPMSGSAAICAIALLDSGILPMTAPGIKRMLEAPGGPGQGRGRIGPDQGLTARSLIGGPFRSRLPGAARGGDRPAVRPEVSGRGWITGSHQLLLAPEDPWPQGDRLSDTRGAH